MNEGEEIYLIHIVEAHQRLMSYFPASKEEFLHDYSKQDATVKILGNITESTKHIHEDTKTSFPHIPWPRVIGLRNRLVHGYIAEPDYERIWYIVHDELPPLVEVVRKVLKEKYKIEL